MKQRQALEMAQEVMRSWQGQAPVGFNEAFQAVNQALEQPEPVQEPVADSDKVICPACCHQFRAIPGNVQRLMLDAGFEPPFTTPPAQPAAWVDLTDEDIEESFAYVLAKYVEEVDPDFHSVSSQVDYLFARAIQAKLREKNGGA
jgi:hypothetical protein